MYSGYVMSQIEDLIGRAISSEYPAMAEEYNKFISVNHSAIREIVTEHFTNLYIYDITSGDKKYNIAIVTPEEYTPKEIIEETPNTINVLDNLIDSIDCGKSYRLKVTKYINLDGSTTNYIWLPRPTYSIKGDGLVSYLGLMYAAIYNIFSVIEFPYWIGSFCSHYLTCYIAMKNFSNVTSDIIKRFTEEIYAIHYMRNIGICTKYRLVNAEAIYNKIRNNFGLDVDFMEIAEFYKTHTISEDNNRDIFNKLFIKKVNPSKLKDDE